MTVFEDRLAETFPDDLHSEDEERCITIGVSSQHRVLFFSHQEFENGIRIIGARPAEPAEIRAYEELKDRF